jgi:hypothetical protein
VLEALLKRVDGLEKRLKDEKKSHSPHNENGSGPDEGTSIANLKPELPKLDAINVADETAVYSPAPSRSEIQEEKKKVKLIARSAPSPAVQPDSLLDTYFTRCHGKPYSILDETTTRQRIQHNRIPSYLLSAMYAVSARWVIRVDSEGIC